MENKNDIKYIILDVDGTLTDGGIYLDNNGNELKKFNVKDGLAIVSAQKLGFKFAIITGRYSAIVSERAEELGISNVYQNIKNKAKVYQIILEKNNLKNEEVAFIGDDLNDFPIFLKAGFTGAPNDASIDIKEKAHFLCKNNGGHGAVREFIEHIIKMQNKWNCVVDLYSFQN